MNDETRFIELWTDYLEGELDGSKTTELSNILSDNPELLSLAADIYQTHRMLGVIANESSELSDSFVSDTLAMLPENSDRFTDRLMRRISSHRKNGDPEGHRHFKKSIETTNRKIIGQFFSKQWGLFAAGIAIFMSVLLWSQSNKQVLQSAQNDQTPSAESAPLVPSRFVNFAHAQFFGELSPPLHSPLIQQRDYTLISGLAELSFPHGASAIIEGPAVFRVLSEECLALDVGHCSIHAPVGAEGFTVKTPVTHIVDCGTSFSVNVTETSETEVQVLNGIADVYSHPESNTKGSPLSDSEFQLRLTEREARKFLYDENLLSKPADFNPVAYRKRLPDRVVSFEATTSATGRAESLLGVTVQRDGVEHRYSEEQLIDAQLTWFKSDRQDPNGHLVGGTSAKRLQADVFSDAALFTGAINPGGSVEPLQSDPVLENPQTADLSSTTPGFAVQFRSPVENGPGPDIVFFEIQTASNPPNGDAFHVSPLKFGQQHRSHTIRTFDLTLNSPESLKLTGFHLYRFDKSVGSLAELFSGNCSRQSVRLGFHVLAVGIDLSDLGFIPGEKVNSLFFQDAGDDNHIVDPVYIGGLPNSTSNSTSTAGLLTVNAGIKK